MGILYIALGGAVGAVARYGLGGFIQIRAGGTFPWGTLAVNVLGSFLLGFLFLYLEATAHSAELRRAVTIGILGAFTTFSTFSYEAAILLQNGEWSRGAAYLGGSVVLGLAAVLAGFGAATALLSTR